MGIVSRLRDTGTGLLSRLNSGESRQLSLEIPGRSGPLWQLQLNLDSTDQADGQMTRLRAHWKLALLRGEISSWMELRASDAALDDASEALVPERLAELGVQPRRDQPVQSWAGELRGPRPGIGVLSLLRLDKSQLPGWLQRRLGARPFQLAATVATAVEESTTPERGR